MTEKISQFQLTKYIFENINSDNSDLTSKEYSILLQLSSFMNSTTLLCNPSKETLSKTSCMSERSADIAVNGLVTKGFITYTKGFNVGSRKSPNSYKLNLDKIYSYVKTEWKPTIPENLIPAPHVSEAGTTGILAETLINPLTSLPIIYKFRKNGTPLLLDSFPPEMGLFEHDMWTDDERSKFVREAAV